MTNTLREKALKACPFCGADNPHVETPVRHAEGEDRLKLLQPYVLCMRCGGIGPSAPTDAEAIAAWNRRASPIEAPGQDMVMVPKEASPEMLESARKFAADPRPGEWPEFLASLYRAFLKGAPSAE